MNKIIGVVILAIIIAIVLKMRSDKKAKDKLAEEEKRRLEELQKQKPADQNQKNLEKTLSIIEKAKNLKTGVQSIFSKGNKGVKLGGPTAKPKEYGVSLSGPGTKPKEYGAYTDDNGYSDYLGDENGIQNLITAAITGGVAVFLYKHTWDRNDLGDNGIGWKAITAIVALIAAVKLKQAVL
jgi:hypothetical protein